MRTRFAPAPSGELHVGNAHTALFAWLFARHHRGTFVLRIEDTDRNRAQPEVVDPVLDSLEWLGLDWDEGPRLGGDHGPYITSERMNLHRDVIARLESSGALYRCWCTREEIRARGRDSGYDAFCRTRPDRPDGPAALRLAVPDGEAVEFDDLVLGRLRREYDEVMDPLVVRSDGSPLYALAVTADDVAMEITHVIRGNDLLDSTFTQVLLYRALGAPLPAFAHLPYLLDRDRKALGKRYGSETLQEFRAEGVLPEALLNYMALIGWSSPLGDEILSRERLVEEFTLDRVNPSNSVFDHRKLRWMNQQYLVRLPVPDLEERALALDPSIPPHVLHAALELGIVQERVGTLAEIAAAVRYLHERVPPAALPAEAAVVLPAVEEALGSIEPWTVDAIRSRLESLFEELGLVGPAGRRKGTGPLYIVLAGAKSGLPIYESIWIIGRDETVARLRAAS